MRPVSRSCRSPVWSLLLHAYGIGVSDTAHPSASPAPQADLMVTVVRGAFGGDLPWGWVIDGGVIALVTIALDGLLAAAGIITGEALIGIFIALPAAWPGLVLILDPGLWSGRVARSKDAGPRARFS